jgi:hypothetical protein
MSANSTSLARNYDLLSPMERFRLTVAAAARDYRDEFERLVDTCPTVLCRISDPRFRDRGDTARLWAMLAKPCLMHCVGECELAGFERELPDSRLRRRDLRALCRSHH